MATRIVWWTKRWTKMPLYKWKHAYLHRELLFISSNPFRTLLNPIQPQYVWWIYPEQVVAELTRVIYGRNQVDSFGAVDSSRVGSFFVFGVKSFFVFDSRRVAENCDSSPSEWLDSLQHCHIVVLLFITIVSRCGALRKVLTKLVLQ